MSNIIDPRCKKDLNQIYISAGGHVMNCCWIGNYPHIDHYYDFFKDELDMLNVNKRPLKDIIESKIMGRIESTWETDNPFPPCSLFCSAKAEKKPDNDEMMGTNAIKKLK